MKYIAPQFELPLVPMTRKPDESWKRDMSTVVKVLSRQDYSLYTDGSCWPNPGPGGWCAILLLNGVRLGNPISGSLAHTTNNQMELCAVINGLMLTPTGAQVTVFTDSQYVQRGATWWCKAWAAKKFRGVKNPVQWKILFELKQRRNCTFKWLRGHNGNELNEECDRLAEKERLKIK